MAPKRRYVRRTAPAPSPEVPEPAVPPVAPEPAGPSEVQELRAQVATLAGRFDRLQELMERQAAAAPGVVEASKARSISGSSPDRLGEVPEVVVRGVLPDSDRQKMREDFRKLKQGNRTVREYEREFTHLLNCVPDVASTEQDRAYCFVRGLRPGVFRLVHAFKFHTFAEALDRALWVEHENTCEREDREAFDKDKGKKRPGGGSGGQSSSKRPRSIRGRGCGIAERSGVCFAADVTSAIANLVDPGP
uniref:Retrotransposon gag domain-containing protein n=1 Tax=Ananas comosus var. bracteatus TaxID=296719 RepID=A0A6V7Q2F9_ANACO|nr:unnamed protein product [Ananas comosus var. bracteatus]